jgi:hypothetical protein
MQRSPRRGVDARSAEDGVVGSAKIFRPETSRRPDHPALRAPLLCEGNVKASLGLVEFRQNAVGAFDFLVGFRAACDESQEIPECLGGAASIPLLLQSPA